MKKILNILVLAMLALTLSGCKKEEKVYTLKDLNHPALNTYTPGEKPGEKNICFSKKWYFEPFVVSFILSNQTKNPSFIEIPETLKGGILKKIEFKVATYTSAYYKYANLTDPNFKNSKLLWEINTKNKTTKLGSFELSYKNKTTEFKQTIENEPISPSYIYNNEPVKKYIKTNTYTNYTWDAQIDCDFIIKEKCVLNFNLDKTVNPLSEKESERALVLDLDSYIEINWELTIDLSFFSIGPNSSHRVWSETKAQFENNSYKFQESANMFLDTIVIYDINLTILK